MAIRCDRVVRREYGDDDCLYSLVLDDSGLYIIHTGFAGPGAQPDEAKLDTAPLATLADDEHSAYLPFAHIHSAVARRRGGTTTLFLQTRQGDFHLSFTQATGDPLELLLQALDTRR